MNYFHALLKSIALIGLFFLSAILMITALLFYWSKFIRKIADKALSKLERYIDEVLYE